MHKLVALFLAAPLLAGCTTGFEPVTVTGDPDDPSVGTGALVLFLYEDYRCSHCNDYATQGGYQHLLDTWVAPGNVSLVFKHVAFVDSLSAPAAVASRCFHATDAGAWPAFDHDLYAKQRAGWLPTTEALADLAQVHGVDGASMANCIQSGDPAVAANTDALRNMGRGTPTIVVDGIGYNAAETQIVDDAIQAALA